MATLNDALTYARVKAQTDSNGLTDTNGVILANEGLLDIRRRLLADGIDASGLQEAYTDMTGGTGTYLYPTDMAWLKAIELNYQGQEQQNYIVAQQVDTSNIPGQASFSWLRQNANTNDPQFNDMGDWFEIFPTPTNNNSQGIRIWYFLEPTQFTSTSDNITYPESLDYTILGLWIASSYLESLKDFNGGELLKNQYVEKLKQWIATLGRGTQQPLQAVPLQITGWNY